MNDNKDAERTEAQLLDKFDYAWNKGSNGVRRHNAVLRKLDGISRKTHLPAFIRKLQLSLEKQKGVRIKACEPLLLENGSGFHDSFKSTNFLPQILKFGRSQPRIVSVNVGVNGDPNIICGVALGHGSVCIRPPKTGNKRCAEHKGMKVNSVKSKLIAEGNGSTRPCVSIDEENSPICGFILDSGASCARIPFQRNKRCMEHKGRRNRGSNSQPTTYKIGQWTHNPILENRTSSSNDCQHILSSKAGRQDSQDFSSSLIHQNYNVICGVHLNDGSFCTSQPTVGRKRCEGHKCMRVKEPISSN